MSYLSCIYLMVLLVRGKDAENIEIKEKIDRRKPLKKRRERKTKNTRKIK